MREAALVRAAEGGQDAHGANSMIKAQVEDRKQQLQIALSLLPSFEFGKLSLPPGGTPLDELPSFEQRQLDLSTGGHMAGSVDDKIISRSESLPLERADSKLGAVGKLRAKSLKVAEALSMSGKPPREEFSSGLDELVLWCAPALDRPSHHTRTPPRPRPPQTDAAAPLPRARPRRRPLPPPLPPPPPP